MEFLIYKVLLLTEYLYVYLESNVAKSELFRAISILKSLFGKGSNDYSS